MLEHHPNTHSITSTEQQPLQTHKSQPHNNTHHRRSFSPNATPFVSQKNKTQTTLHNFLNINPNVNLTEVETAVHAKSDAMIRIGSINMASATMHQLPQLIDYIQDKQLDILCLQDTGNLNPNQYVIKQNNMTAIYTPSSPADPEVEVGYMQ